MRKIERTMIDALLGERACKRGNDEVRLYDSQPDGARVVWFYHDNNIAWVNDAGKVIVTFFGYGTATTRSRLNALCSVVAPHICFTQHKHEQYICYTGTDAEGNRWEIPTMIDDLHRTFVIADVPTRAARSGAER